MSNKKAIQIFMNRKFHSTLMLLVIFIFISVSYDAFSQNVNILGANDFVTKNLIARTNSFWMLDGQYEEIEGSPYLNDEFEEGEILLKDSSLYRNVLLRFNIYSDDLEFQSKGFNYAFTAKALLEKFTLGEDEFVVEIMDTRDGETYAFFSLLAGGKANLLRKYNVEFKDKVPYTALVDAQPMRFLRKDDTFFIKVGLKRIYEFKSIKKLIEYLGDQQDELKEFSKKENISPRNPEELTKFIEFYNSL